MNRLWPSANNEHGLKQGVNWKVRFTTVLLQLGNCSTLWHSWLESKPQDLTKFGTFNITSAIKNLEQNFEKVL